MNEAADIELELEEEVQKGLYLTFILEKETYGIEIGYVTEIIGLQTITPLPELPLYIRGIINLRGKIIPVMDVRVRFKKEFQEYNDRTCIIVIDIQDISIGIIVDSVAEVVNIAESEIVPPPQLSGTVANKFLKGIGKTGDEVKLLLDCQKLLNDDETDMLRSV